MKYVKKVLALKEIAARILAAVVEEVEILHMCNLSEAIWEKGVAAVMAKAIAEGEVNNYTWIFDKLMSKGFEFDEVVDLLDVSPETADKVRGNLTPKTVSRNLSKKIIPIWDRRLVLKRFPI